MSFWKLYANPIKKNGIQNKYLQMLMCLLLTSKIVLRSFTMIGCLKIQLQNEIQFKIH